MNKYAFFSGLAMLGCMFLVGVACELSGCAWYVWVLVLPIALAVMAMENIPERPKKEMPVKEQRIHFIRCFFCSVSTLGITSVLLGVMGEKFGDVVILLLSLATILLSGSHLADKKGKLLWWLSLTLTMFGLACFCIFELLGGSSEIAEIIYFVLLGFLAVTLIIGFALYIYPPIMDLSFGIKGTNETIKDSDKNDSC